MDELVDETKNENDLRQPIRFTKTIPDTSPENETVETSRGASLDESVDESCKLVISQLEVYWKMGELDELGESGTSQLEVDWKMGRLGELDESDKGKSLAFFVEI